MDDWSIKYKWNKITHLNISRQIKVLLHHYHHYGPGQNSTHFPHNSTSECFWPVNSNYTMYELYLWTYQLRLWPHILISGLHILLLWFMLCYNCMVITSELHFHSNWQTEGGLRVVCCWLQSLAWRHMLSLSLRCFTVKLLGGEDSSSYMFEKNL